MDFTKSQYLPENKSNQFKVKIIVKPFLKWAGNKHRVRDNITPYLPERKRLIEPFAGSCAISLATHYENYLIADTNSDLIDMYNHIKYHSDSIIEETEGLFVPENNNSEEFYTLRSEFNEINASIRKSALFIYLNRHCFNGLCRYNRKGKFNVPFGKYKSPKCPTLDILSFSEFSMRAEFVNQSFQETFAMAGKDDVIYCDPPYVPLSATSNFTAYSKESFGPLLQEDLAVIAESTASGGVPVLISNHNIPITRDLYSSALIKSFDVQRLISSKAASRGKVSELLAIYA